VNETPPERASVASADSCPRCAGLTTPIDLTECAGVCTARRCLICGWIFDEGLLDYHHGLVVPPDPHPDAQTPVYDPKRQRLVYDEALDALRWETVAPVKHPPRPR
jgi:hypothetical protein